MEGFVKSYRPHWSPPGWSVIARSSMLLSLLLLLPLASYGKVKRQASSAADAPSGFFPGFIFYFAGDGPSLSGSYSDGAVPTLVPIPTPGALASDKSGNIYFASGSAMYVVYVGGTVPATVANITTAPTPGRIYQITGVQGTCGQIADATCGEGMALNLASFGSISGLAFDSASNLYISDGGSDVIRKVDATTSIVTTIVGQLNAPSSSSSIGDGGPASAASLYEPTDIKFDAYGNLFINDYLDDVVRVVYSGTQAPPILAAVGITGAAGQPGYINTVAGQVLDYCTTLGGCGDGTSATTSASLGAEESIAIDSGGNLFIADTFPGSGAYIRIVYAGVSVPPLLNLALNPGGGSSVAPTNGYMYAATGYGPNTQYVACVAGPCGDGGLAADVQFGNDVDAGINLFVTLDSLGNLYVLDAGDWAVRKIDTSGYASTIAGIDAPGQNPPANPPAAAGGAATSTQLSAYMYAIAFDPQNNLYITDIADDLVWQVAPLQSQQIDFPAFDPAAVTYGGGPIALSATASSNLAVSYAVASGPGKISGSNLIVTGVGTIVVTASQAGNDQYAAATPVSESLTVDPAALAVAANNATKVFGAANPTFSATITGFVNGDSPTTPGAYSGAPAFSTTATANSPQGEYPITVSLGTLASTNYTFATFVPGTLTVGGSTPQSIAFAPLAPITYGQVTTLNLNATASSGLPVTLQVLSGPGTIPASGSTLTITGAGTIVVQASQPGAGPYEAATPVTQSLVVSPAPLTVTGPTVTVPYGAPINPGSFPAVTIAGFAGSDTQAAIITGAAHYTTITGTPDAGTYPINVSLGTLAVVPSAAANYILATPVNGTLIVKPRSGALNPLPGYIYYFAGDGPGLSGIYGDGSLPTEVPLPNPTAIAADSSGNIYFATGGSLYVVYAGLTVPATLANITANPVSGSIYQIAGLVGICGNIADATCGEGKTLNLAAFGKIAGLAFDSTNSLYISDSTADVIRRVDAISSIVTTAAGQLNTPSSSVNIGDGAIATSATLSEPADVKVDSFGNFYFSDQSGSVARVVYTTGASGPPPILAAEGIAAQPGAINTIAGKTGQFCASVPTAGSSGSPGACGDYGAATGASALFLRLNSLAVDPLGNVYFADAHSGSSPAAAYIRIIYAGGGVPPLLNQAQNGVAPIAGNIYAATGYSPNAQFGNCTSAPCGDGGAAGGMEFGASANDLFLLLDSSGNLYIADSGDLAIRKINASALAATVAGIDDPNQAAPVQPPAAQANPATSTQLSRFLYGVALDPQGNLYITDNADDLVWQVAPLLQQFIDFTAFNPATVSYGVAPITLAATSSSGLAVTYTVASGPGTINGSQLAVTGVGTIVVSASQPGNSQYQPAADTQSLVVTPVSLTVTANNATKDFGSPNPTFSATFTGFVNGDTQTTAGVYSGVPAFSTTATTNSAQGSYPITVSSGSLASANYTFATFVAGTLTINGYLSQTISFSTPTPVTYGQPASLSLTATASSGLPVTLQVVSGPGTISSNGSILTVTGGGTVVITASQAGSGSYLAATPVTRSLVVNPAPLTVNGPTITVPYGTTIDPTTFPPVSVTGFVGADTQSSVITGKAQYSTVTGTPNTGTYPITVALGSLAVVPGAAANYVLSTPLNGSLIVGPAAQAITVNPFSTSQMYGTLSPLTAVASSGLPVTFTVTGPAYFYNGTSTTAPPSTNTVQVNFTGVGTVTINATQAGNAEYAPATLFSQTITVGPAPLNIGVAQLYIREQGANNPVFQPAIGGLAGQPGGFVNGDSDIPSVITGLPALTTVATQSSLPGVYPVVPTVGTLAAPNYYFNFINGTLTVTPPGNFNLTASPSSLSIAAGLTGQSTLTITPTNAYQGAVTLSCGPLPANVSCEISPATYVFPGSQNPDGSENPAQGTITITANGGTVVGSNEGKRDSISRATMLLIPAAVTGLLLAVFRRRSTRNSGIWGASVLLTLGAGMLLTCSCGGSSKSMTASAGTMTVTIIGTGTSISGGDAITSSAALSVTIQ
jgi:hypothetical protein